MKSSTPADFQPPNTYWRVSAKALIFDDQNRLLVSMDKDREWEIPGGGWEHDETFEQCMTRELSEEMQARVTHIGPVAFCYTAHTAKGRPKLCIAAKVTIDDTPITPTDDDLIESKYVTKEEFLALRFQASEYTVKDYADQIWV